jgi:hypothetical protein
MSRRLIKFSRASNDSACELLTQDTGASCMVESLRKGAWFTPADDLTWRSGFAFRFCVLVCYQRQLRRRCGAYRDGMPHSTGKGGAKVANDI